MIMAVVRLMDEMLIRSLSHCLQGFKNIPCGWEWDFFHQQYESSMGHGGVDHY